jgi:hypothetical protein
MLQVFTRAAPFHYQFPSNRMTSSSFNQLSLSDRHAGYSARIPAQSVTAQWFWTAHIVLLTFIRQITDVGCSYNMSWKGTLIQPSSFIDADGVCRINSGEYLDRAEK